MVLRREASRAEALFYHPAGMREVLLPLGGDWRVDTADRAGIVFAGKRYRRVIHREDCAAGDAWNARFPTWQSLFGTAELPA